MTKDLIRIAIRELKPMTAMLDGLPREFCPHVLGTKDGEWRTLVWQFAGQSSHGLLPGGEWRCFKIADLQNLTLGQGPWQRGWTTGQREQVCVAQIDTIVDHLHAAELREISTVRIRRPALRRPAPRRW